MVLICIDSIHCDGTCSSKDTCKSKARSIATISKLVKSNCEIRGQYLRKLGVVQASSQRIRGKNYHNHQQHQPKIRPAPFSYREMLEIDSPEKNEIFTSLSPIDIIDFDHLLALFPTKRPSVVTFDVTVDVRVIPNKDMYSKSIRKFLWNSPEELYLNARRNFVEFKSEGKQIHPVHMHWIDHVMNRRR
eukprot:scaffold656_cov271-Chaetoceros_neogracile.AAC.91